MAAHAPPLIALALLPGVVTAQGVTTAAIQGRVARADGVPIPDATVRVVNVSNGRRWEVVTRSSGVYLFEDVGVGGPYRIEARALGFAPEARSGIGLVLGQRLVADFVLRPVAIELAPVDVTAAPDPSLHAGRTGPSEIVSRQRIVEHPNLGRDFITLTMLSPHVAISPSSGTAGSGGITIAGQNRLYNSFQIDGGVNHDLYTGRLPGRETLPRPISLEALEEIQVLPAPFDIRHGGFAGGLVNAVTKSGTNAIHGSMFGYLGDAALVGQNVTGEDVGDFTTWQYGGTASGPIVRDRAQFFLSVDVRHENVPDPGPLITDTAGGADLARIGISYASALRFQELLRDMFSLDPGTLGPVDGRVRAQDVFGKVTVQLGTNSHLELSHHYARGDRWGFLTRTRNFYFLSSTSQRDPSTSNASRLIWSGLVGRGWSNQLIVSRLRLDDTCRPSAGFAQIRVMGVDGPGGVLVAGTAGGNCPIEPLNSVEQEAFEVTDNLSGALGSHVVTVGTHGEALRFEDGLLTNATGQWNFSGLDRLQQRDANRYFRTLPGAASTGVLQVHARQIGAYIQDRWTAARGFTATLGLRVDASILADAVATNTALRDSLGIDTGRLPSGDPLWSPRLAVNYDLRAEGRTFIRGGIGLFSGRFPYQWVGSAYRDQGARELFVDCRGRAVPPFDPAIQYDLCADGTGPLPRLSFFDPRVKAPQNLRLALGVDHRLPGGVLGTVDVLYTHAVRQMYVSDANLGPPIGFARGEGNRPLYGTINAAGQGTPARRDTTFDRVVRVSNRSGDHALSLSVQLRKRFGDRVEASAFYAYTRSRDRMSVVNPTAHRNLENTPLDGTLQARRLRTSYFEVPHRVRLGATVRLPWRTWVSLSYAGASGTPYTHMVQGDANADGIGGVPFFNDPVYVPRDRGDIILDGNGRKPGLGPPGNQEAAYAVLDALIEAEPCLRRQRGRILERNSCRNPWFGTVNARLAKALPAAFGHSLQLTADVYNVLNLLNRRWGQYRRTIPDPWVQTLALVGYDAGTERGVYEYVFRGLRTVRDLESRWQVELGVRYVF